MSKPFAINMEAQANKAGNGIFNRRIYHFDMDGLTDWKCFFADISNNLARYIDFVAHWDNI